MSPTGLIVYLGINLLSVTIMLPTGHICQHGARFSMQKAYLDIDRDHCKLSPWRHQIRWCCRDTYSSVRTSFFYFFCPDVFQTLHCCLLATKMLCSAFDAVSDSFSLNACKCDQSKAFVPAFKDVF